ncbi:MAG TPA: ISL3 family transposase [Polyangiaceae bacterium]|nr:ISL3 family transposase [Polyangiaceae bacterium]
MKTDRWESKDGRTIEAVAGYDVPADARLVLVLERRWSPRCAKCLAIGGTCHEKLAVRRWADLPACGHPVIIEYAPDRLRCKRCGARAVELLAWADGHQRQTRRLQHHLALDAFSMPLVHVSTKWGLSWHTVRRAELCAIDRWDKTTQQQALTMVGVDEKWLGRRHKRKEKFVTIVSDLATGVPVWMGYGRGSETLKSWLDSLTAEQKAAIRLFATDMHEPFKKAIREDPALAHAAHVHDPFHVIKRAGEAVTELRRSIFFRAGPELRAIGKGTRWLVLRSWERQSDEQRAHLRQLFRLNGKLARAYQLVEELRAVLRAPDGKSLYDGLWRILRRTERRDNVPMRKLHESIKAHLDQIVALGELRPPTGRIEALNNNWETLVRRGRGYRNHAYLLAKLRFITANPVRNSAGIKRFLALGIPTPTARAA